MRLSEVIGAMSSALDVVEVQPMGHCARSRTAMVPARVLSIMAEDVPAKLDAEVFAALQAHLGS